jgi:hypothetical protein
MRERIGAVVADQQVWDLGAGDLTHARMLLDLGAQEVVAVDYSGLFRANLAAWADPRIDGRVARFHEVEAPPTIPVAWVSWPFNHYLRGLVPLLQRSRQVIYLGANTDGSACGWADLFEHLIDRELLTEIPHRRNSLLIYGAQQEGRQRRLAAEEFAATQMLQLSLEQAQAMVALDANLPRRDEGHDSTICRSMPHSS